MIWDYSNVAVETKLDHMVAVTSPGAIKLIRSMVSHLQTGHSGLKDYILLGGDQKVPAFPQDDLGTVFAVIDESPLW